MSISGGIENVGGVRAKGTNGDGGGKDKGGKSRGGLRSVYDST